MVYFGAKGFLGPVRDYEVPLWENLKDGDIKGVHFGKVWCKRLTTSKRYGTKIDGDLFRNFGWLPALHIPGKANFFAKPKSGDTSRRGKMEKTWKRF